MKTVVLKFGGTSVGNLNRIKIVAKIISSYIKKRFKVIVVSSAMSGATNDLIKKAKELTKGIKKIQVIHLDKRVNSSRSINIINYLVNKKKLKNIYLIIGADNLINFHKWKDWKRIVKLTKLIVFSRKGYDRKGSKSTVTKYYKNKITFIKNRHIVISSTKLRKKLV